MPISDDVRAALAAGTITADELLELARPRTVAPMTVEISPETSLDDPCIEPLDGRVKAAITKIRKYSPFTTFSDLEYTSEDDLLRISSVGSSHIPHIQRLLKANGMRIGRRIGDGTATVTTEWCALPLETVLNWPVPERPYAHSKLWYRRTPAGYEQSTIGDLLEVSLADFVTNWTLDPETHPGDESSFDEAELTSAFAAMLAGDWTNKYQIRALIEDITDLEHLKDYIFEEYPDLHDAYSVSKNVAE
jgi:hypothetical protein